MLCVLLETAGALLGLAEELEVGSDEELSASLLVFSIKEESSG